MRKGFKILLLLGLGGLLLTLMGVLAGGAYLADIINEPGVSISVNGEDLDLGGLDAMPLPDLLGGLLVAGLIVFLVLPLVLLLSLGLPLLLLGLALTLVVVGVVGLGSLLFSPLILIVLVLWLALRNKPAKPRHSTNPTA